MEKKIGFLLMAISLTQLSGCAYLNHFWTKKEKKEVIAKTACQLKRDTANRDSTRQTFQELSAQAAALKKNIRNYETEIAMHTQKIRALEKKRQQGAWKTTATKHEGEQKIHTLQEQLARLKKAKDEYEERLKVIEVEKRQHEPSGTQPSGLDVLFNNPL
ncbi:hypothetical protein LJC71_07455 [Desulfosarcina sp. OttesenSCG-928-A07]|nr:hypothetical protein [Desulfosarcina sp. OttesenSCG-928-G17]MDL2329561.1 hypothetical protein [Desulfosarcina sp. OttesenSCG-928-A07]